MGVWICVDCGDGRCEDCVTPRCDHDCQGLADIDDGPDVSGLGVVARVPAPRIDQGDE